VGNGTEAKAGANVEVHYVGVAWSTQSEFDASWNRRETFEFRLGAGQVISGWDQGVAGMKVGGRRRLTIPAHLGYGNQGAGGVIKGGETLVFVVDLLNVN
jgi:peptidylprolyl isomerase